MRKDSKSRLIAGEFRLQTLRYILIVSELGCSVACVGQLLAQLKRKENGMTTPFQYQRVFSPALVLTVVSSVGLLLLTTGDSIGQVRIEGGPGPIQMSDNDGRPEAAVPGGSQGRSSFRLETRIAPDAILAPTPLPRQTIIVDSTVDLRDITEVKAIQPVAPEDEASTAKRKSELRRSLKIADSGTGAIFSFFTENLFEEDLPLVTSVATAQLQEAAEFIELSEAQRVTITYYFVPDDHSEKLAQERSLGLVEWMKTRGGLSEVAFDVNNPATVTEPTPTEGDGNSGTTSLRNQVEFVIEYRAAS
jgi:hypothetical protein